MKRYLPLILGVVLLLVIPSFSFAQSEPARDLPLPAQSEPAGTTGSTGIAAPDVPTEFLEKPAIMPVPPDAPLPFGQTHYYTVTLRGNGDALVYLKTVFPNTEQAPLSSMQFTFPGTPDNLSAYQVIRQPQCIRYKLGMRGSLVGVKDEDSQCAEYQEPDYLYGWGNTSYQKAQVSVEGNTVTVTLPTAIKANGTGSIVLSYRGQGITTKDLFGAYHYAFQTIKVKDTIQNLQVGIMTDPDYYLKDPAGTINYQTKEAGISMAAPMAADRMSLNSAQFDQFYNQIGQGTIVKNVNNLQPNESYDVKGAYADNRMKLYGKEVAWGAGVVVVVLLFAFIGLFVGVKKVYGKSVKENGGNKTVMAFLPVVGLSFGSSLVIMLYTGFLYGLSYVFGQLFPYYAMGSLYPLILILIGVISLSIYSLFLFGPGVVMGIKKSLLSGILTVVLTIFWLIMYSIVLVVIFFMLSQNNSGQPVPYMMRSAVQPMMSVEGSAPAADVLISK